MKVGDYMGSNHGKVVAINDSSVELLELVSDVEPGGVG